MSAAVAGCVSNPGEPISAAGPTVGQWRPFYSIDFHPGRLDYSYDASRVVRTGDHVVSRWKVVGSPTETTTLSVVDISCTDATFTEMENMIIDAQGRVENLQPSELLVDRPISPGSSSDVIRGKFCR